MLSEGNAFATVGSSNGRTTPFGGVCRGSNPLPTARMIPDDAATINYEVKRVTIGTN